MNGAAHIMNDEATRKYLQAIKRLQTFMQRAYPTDPSRSVDFDGFRDAGLGAKGAGSDKAVSCFQPCILSVTGSLINQFTFSVFRTHQGSQQTIIGETTYTLST